MSDTIKFEYATEYGKISKEGAAKVANVILLHEPTCINRADAVVAFKMDIDTRCGEKRAIMDSSYKIDGAPAITLHSDTAFVYYIDVYFPEYVGWSVHACEGGKEIKICLTKDDDE